MKIKVSYVVDLQPGHPVFWNGGHGHVKELSERRIIVTKTEYHHYQNMQSTYSGKDVVFLKGHDGSYALEGTNKRLLPLGTPEDAAHD